ncbi:YcdB/YcdC domain-containing protein [Clostridiisalibacter paucivorans]|uniref:YcdB/YcdC domain-containing protein n=1 Tax=Clostridiisalibacter paucivorans TaxID=408753 RepID=UPI00047DB06F|nr:YcdB/YcdC domain-containing protein [Clostridiisalibacter paucivorans]
MKKKKVLASFLAFSILAGSGYGIYDLGAKNIGANNIKPNVVYAEKGEQVSNKDLKERSIEMLKKYFQDTPDFNELNFSSTTETKNGKIEEFEKIVESNKKWLEILEDIDLANMEKPSKSLEDSKADVDEFYKNVTILQAIEIRDTKGLDKAEEYLETIIKNRRNSIKTFGKMKDEVEYGIEYAIWESEDEAYRIAFNKETGELLGVTHDVKMDKNKINPSKFVSIEDAKEVAQEFLANHNLDGIENVKLVKSEEFQDNMGKDNLTAGFDHNAIAFFYEDEDDASKKANVILDRITGEVTGFDLGKAAEGVSYKTSPQ